MSVVLTIRLYAEFGGFFSRFFVENSLFEAHLRIQVPVPDTSIEALHDTTMGTDMYQLYDGTLKLAGCQKLLWHRKRIEEANIQVLPMEARAFPFRPLEQSSDAVNDEVAAAAAAAAVDISPFLESALPCQPVAVDTARTDCAAALRAVLAREGIALVKNTGVSRAVCEQAMAAARAFFDEATPESVRESALAVDRARRGYSRTNTENFAMLVGQSAPNDSVRKFRMGADVSDQGGLGSELQPNAWPAPEAWGEAPAAEFRAALEAYYEALCTASRGILAAIVAGLDDADSTATDSTAIRSLTSEHDAVQTSILTVLGYSAKKKKRKRNIRPLVAAHTDVGVITVLLFDPGDCAVLQRCAGRAGEIGGHSAGGEWKDVTLPFPTSDPIFLVQVGDCLSEVSGGTLKSTLHRVAVGPGSSPRASLALFVGLGADTEVVIGGERRTYGAWRKERIARLARAAAAAAIPHAP